MEIIDHALCGLQKIHRVPRTYQTKMEPAPKKVRPYKGKAYERARLKKVYWFVEDDKPKCPTKPLGAKHQTTGTSNLLAAPRAIKNSKFANGKHFTLLNKLV